jgi:arginyl-tRNA synthetase
MNIFDLFLTKLSAAIKDLYGSNINLNDIVVEYPKDKTHGDLSTNCAMVLSKRVGKNPREIAQELLSKITKFEWVERCEVAGPGFININLMKEFWSNLIPGILKAGQDYGKSNLGKGKKVNIEFVSANPTGPMHIGHSRGAIYGDALASLLEFEGFKVTREYYINDSGGQIDILAKSVFIRYKQLLGYQDQIPEGCYPGEYLIPVAKELKEEYADKLIVKDEIERNELIKKFAVESMINLIKSDLKKLGVVHDAFVSERFDIIEKGKNEEAFNLLEKKGLIYRGILEAPKGKVVEDWEPREQMLFKSTDFGDDVDRPLKKANGSFTYFAPDIAYHLDKIQRGFEELILLLGADHSGYVKRIKAAVEALSEGKVKLDVKINQLVNLLNNGEPYKMSKRAGKFVTVEDMIDEVGKDILRFVMLSRKSDTILDLDFVKVKEQSKENPVFYVQYAHTRACSVIKKADNDQTNFTNVNYSLLQDQAEIDLIKQIALFPKLIEASVLTHEPHRVTFYLFDLANEVHALWSKGVESENLRFIIENNIEITRARLALVLAAKNTLALGLKILGITALEQM